MPAPHGTVTSNDRTYDLPPAGLTSTSTYQDRYCLRTAAYDRHAVDDPGVGSDNEGHSHVPVHRTSRKPAIAYSCAGICDFLVGLIRRKHDKQLLYRRRRHTCFTWHIQTKSPLARRPAVPAVADLFGCTARRNLSTGKVCPDIACLLPTHYTIATVRLLTTHGALMTQLLAKQRALNTDLIVVAKRDKSLMEELLTENISLQLAARSNCDVLNVR